MSLILGVNLPDMLYLVSDTRLTHKLNGENFYQDNFSKFYSFNESISVIVAGDSNLANYLLNKISDSEIINKGFIYFENNIKEFLRNFADDYMRSGNKFKPVFFIFAGFDKQGKKKINSSNFGRFYSEPIKHKTGIQNQSINKKIMEGFVRVITTNNNSLPANTEFEIDLPYSNIITIEIDLPNKLDLKEVDCFKYIMRAPKKLTENNLSAKIFYQLDQSRIQSKSGKDMLYNQAAILMGLVNQIIKDYKLDTVGGSIIVNIITLYGALTPAGDLRYLNIKTGKIERVSEILVKDDKFCVRGITGDIIPLQNIYDFNKKGNFEL
ncbi:hypothetical protein KAU19_06125 [Candidatus Parcubacteria bacterium]|nr:hypothetical protein [Candidatus Parcubacteria bacterium]